MANNSEIQILRQQQKGDLVVLLTNANYTQYLTKTRNYDADPYNAYAVVKASIANNNYAFVHILSHLLSTRHARCNEEPGALCDDNHPYSHSWRFNTGNFWSGYQTNTTVEHHVSYGSVLLNFSNAIVYHMGQATGTPSNDNSSELMVNSDNFMRLRISPNPVKEQLQVAFKVDKEEEVKIKIVDLRGKTLGVLTNQRYQKGTHQLSYDCKDLIVGTYVCKLELGGAFVKAEKLILSK